MINLNERNLAVKNLIDRVLKVKNNNLNSVFRSDYYDSLRDRDVCLLTFVFNSAKVPSEAEDILSKQEDSFDDNESDLCAYPEYGIGILDALPVSRKIYPNKCN